MKKNKMEQFIREAAALTRAISDICERIIDADGVVSFKLAKPYQQITVWARRCARRNMGDPRYGEYVFTGGMVCGLDFNSPAKMSSSLGWRSSLRSPTANWQTKRIKAPGSTISLERALERMLARGMTEHVRISRLEELDALCDPFRRDAAYMRAVRRHELALDKISCYDTLTLAEIEHWRAWIERWGSQAIKRNK